MNKIFGNLHVAQKREVLAKLSLIGVTNGTHTSPNHNFFHKSKLLFLHGKIFFSIPKTPHIQLLYNQLDILHGTKNCYFVTHNPIPYKMGLDWKRGVGGAHSESKYDFVRTLKCAFLSSTSYSNQSDKQFSTNKDAVTKMFLIAQFSLFRPTVFSGGDFLRCE